MRNEKKLEKLKKTKMKMRRTANKKVIVLKKTFMRARGLYTIV